MFSASTSSSSHARIGRYTSSASLPRCPARMNCSATSRICSRAKGAAGFAPITSSHARAGCVLPACILEIKRPSSVRSPLSCPPGATFSVAINCAHDALSFWSNSASFAVAPTTTCLRCASFSPSRSNCSRASLPCFSSASPAARNSRSVSYSARPDSRVCSRFVSKPDAVIVSWSGRDSPRLPFRSTARSFIVIESPAFTFIS